MTTTLNIEEELAFSASTPTPDDDFDFSQFSDRVGDGFNQYGVRENYDDEGNLQSVDVLFEAMEPGPPKRRNGVRITEDFLQKVGEKDYSHKPPHLRDHEDKNSFAKLGDVENVWFSNQTDSLWLMNRVPNTGTQTHDEAIKRYTHDPPSWREGSMGFGDNYTAVRNSDGEPELEDGTMREFSHVLFPGGYDDGGVKATFAEAAKDAVVEFDDASQEGAGDGDEAEDSATDPKTDFAVQTETITFD